jgi:hypothetical protein
VTKKSQRSGDGNKKSQEVIPPLLPDSYFSLSPSWFLSYGIHAALMKITQKIEQSIKDDKVWWSFEYFPPRTAQVLHFTHLDRGPFVNSAKGLQNLLDRIERMRALGPEFIDITW